MELYNTKQALYDSCTQSEEGIYSPDAQKPRDYIAEPVYSEEDGELLGYRKYYID